MDTLRTPASCSSFPHTMYGNNMFRPISRLRIFDLELLRWELGVRRWTDLLTGADMY